MAVEKKDIVLTGKNGNETSVFLPVTRLGNVVDEAEIKAEPAETDYIPLIDSADDGQMKKTPLKSLLEMPDEHLNDDVRHITALEREQWNGKAAGSHSHTAAEVGALTNIKIGTVTTGTAGSQAAASASTSGTVTTLNLAFRVVYCCHLLS